MSEETPISPSEAKQKADKLKEIARDYDKQAWALLLVAPLAMLTYSMDKVGVIGFSACWEWVTWFAWLSLFIGVAVSGWRMFVISNTWHLKSAAAKDEAKDIGDESRVKSKKAADDSETLNKKLRSRQIVIIGVGFFLLALAHFISACEARPVKDKEDKRIEVLEKAIKLDRLEKEAKQRSLSVP